jgi:hypothetical protein
MQAEKALLGEVWFVSGDRLRLPKPYSTFCTCSRICSIATFMSTAMVYDRVKEHDSVLLPTSLRVPIQYMP